MTRQENRRSFVLLPLAILAALALTAAIFARHDPPPAAAIGENSLTFPDPAVANDTGSESSMKLDGNGFPVVAYKALGAGFGSQIKLLHCNDVNCAGGDESVEIAFLTAFGAFSPSLSLDSAGNPIITFVHFGINVLHCNDVDCAGSDESLVTHGACCPSEARHVLAPGDLPVVFFRHNGMQMLRCANTNCTALSNDSTLLVQPANSYSYSFTLDASGFPVVGYIGNNTASGGDLMLMHCNDLNCDPAVNGADSNILLDDTMIGGRKVFYHVALALVDGNPVLAYSHFDTSTLKVARCDDANCAAGGDTIESANTNTGAHSPGIAIDDDGFPVVAYYDSFSRTFVLHCNDASCAGGDENNHLVLTHGSNSPPNTSPISIALDANGIPIASMYKGNGNDLAILHCGDVNCSVPAPPTPTNTPPATNTPAPAATHTPTNTPIAPTATNTPVPPTATHTPTSTPVAPTATSTPETCLGASGAVLASPYDEDYQCMSLGAVPGLPTNYGGLTVMPGDPNTLLIGGLANQAGGDFYTIGVTRDGGGHITGFTGNATFFADGYDNDGGVSFGPDGVLFYARYSDNEIGQIKPATFGQNVTDKITSLTSLGVAPSVGALGFVPAGFPNAGALKVASFNAGLWYELPLTPDGAGLFNPGTASPAGGIAIGGGPEGVAFVPEGSAQFAGFNVLVAEYSSGRVSTFTLDGNADPIVATRQNFITGLTGAEGATIDPLTGDFLFSTFGGGSQVIRVSGFEQPPTVTPTNTPVPPSSTPTSTSTHTPTHTSVPPTSTFTPTHTPTNTAVPPTSTFTPTNTPVAPTATHTPTNTPTNTPVPPTATHTATNTPVPPTNTPTNTPVSPTSTFTPIHTPTNTAVPPTATHTPPNTPIPPTATHTPTNTPVLPTATHTPTNTPVPPTATFTPTHTSVPPTNTPVNTATNTPIPPTSTNTPVPPTATKTATPTNTAPPTADRCADINRDGRVNVGDMLRIAVHIFRPYSAPHDINHDGRVTIADLFAAARQYGRRC